MAATSTLEPIPQPAPLPWIGNLREIDRQAPFQSFARLARTFGPIFRMDLPGRGVVVLSGRDLIAEACDEQRFDKLIGGGLRAVRAYTGDGLFTARTAEPNWRKAHNILLPNFGLEAMQGYHPQMVDIADQLMAKWDRLNPNETVDVPDEMTRLTLDTIGLCGFDYRFNSFYREEPHPFVQAMVRAMRESLLQSNRPKLQEAILFRSHRRQEKDIAFMNEVVDGLIRERKADVEALASKHDLLNHMLNGVDKQTGERLDVVNIRYQILTFLIAGHETTSGLLSFAIYLLLKNPEALAKATEEVDQVFETAPDSSPTQAQVRRLNYVRQVLNESLRLWPTAPAFSLAPREDTTLGGRYALKKGDNLLILLPMLHRDPSVWGDDPEAFDPDRFTPERERQLPPHAYKPFGNGQRACIGRQFAMLEATLVLGMILRRFELIDHANYQLRVKNTLTIKPDGFTIKIKRRKARSRSVASTPEPTIGQALAAVEASLTAGPGTPLLILYGSNLGTAEGIARRIQEDGRALGFSSEVGPLDDHAGRLPGEGVVVVVTSSYNGKPPDNAARFCDWLEAGSPAAPDSLRSVRYAVFGCGDRNWAATYQTVPKLIDEALAARGASRIHPRGEGDASDDFDGQFGAWYAPFWGRVASAIGLEIKADAPKARPSLRIEPVAGRVDLPFVEVYGANPMIVVASRELQTREGTKPSERSTRHIELALPEGMTYRAGDHLGVLLRNRPTVVGRVVARFELAGESQVILRRDDSAPSTLPLDIPIRLSVLLASYVELQETATRGQIAALAEKTPCPPEKVRLTALLGGGDEGGSGYRQEILAKHLSVLDLLERFPACELSFEEFLGLLGPLRPRYYSICSSPLVGERVAGITVAVVTAPARSGRGVFEGVASNYLADSPVGSTVFGFIRPPGSPFRPPEDPTTPMIMIGAGTGLAPFRGFLQERAALKDRGREVGPSLLFFGCRNPEHDFLYKSELRDYEARGLTRLVSAFSRVEGEPRCYVQHKIASLGDEVWDLIGRGAVIYVCGDAARLAGDVRSTFLDLHRSKTGASLAEAESWLGGLRSSSCYLEDVWASG